MTGGARARHQSCCHTLAFSELTPLAGVPKVERDEAQANIARFNLLGGVSCGSGPVRLDGVLPLLSTLTKALF